MTSFSSSSSSSSSSMDVSSVTDVLLFPWIIELIGVFVLFILTKFNLPFPYAAVIFIIGAISGTIAVHFDDDDNDNSKSNGDINIYDTYINTWMRSVDTWARIDGSLLLLIFLPGLIFADAISTDFETFKLALGQILILAFPMVGLGTLLTGLVAYFLLPYQWTTGQVLTLGAILASTDPIAVSSVLKTAGASPRLVMMISGESLLNDGSSVVLYTIFSHLAFFELNLNGSSPVLLGESILLFIQMSVGGCIVGCLFGGLLIMLLYMLDQFLEPEYDILQVVAALCMAYLSYYVCDHFLSMSGVVACVSCGLIAVGFGKGLINDEHLMKTHLELMEHLLNTLLFALGGVIWAEICFEDRASYRVQPTDWIWLGMLYVMVLAIRFIQVASMYPFFSTIGLKSNVRESIFLAYGGLRGSVGVALGLSFVRHVYNATTDPTIRKLTTIMQFMGGGVTFLTLTINGTSAGYVLKLLGLAKPPSSRKRALMYFEGLARDCVNEQCQKLLNEPRFEVVDFNVLLEYVPFLTKEPTKLPHSGASSNSTEHEINPPLSSIQNDGRSYQRRTSSGEQYLRVISASTRFLKRDGSENGTCPNNDAVNLMIEIRTVFLELLQEAYQVLVDLGELDEKEDNGHMLEIFNQSVKLSLNSIEHDDQHELDDWNYLLMFRADAKKLRLEEFNESRDAVLNWPIRFYKNDVLFPIIFVEAHSLAEIKLKSYMNRMNIEESHEAGKIVSAVERVISESQREVKKAHDMLQEDVDSEIFEIVLDRYCARILLRRFMSFVDQKAKDGVLWRSEARTLLEKSEKQVQKVINDSIDKIKAQLKIHRSSRLRNSAFGIGKIGKDAFSDRTSESIQETSLLLPNS